MNVESLQILPSGILSPANSGPENFIWAAPGGPNLQPAGKGWRPGGHLTIDGAGCVYRRFTRHDDCDRVDEKKVSLLKTPRGNCRGVRGRPYSRKLVFTESRRGIVWKRVE